MEAKLDCKRVLKEMVRINVEEVNVKKVFEEGKEFSLYIEKGACIKMPVFIDFYFLVSHTPIKSLYKAGVQ